MSNIEKVKAYIERLYDGEAPKHDQQCGFEDGYFNGLATILNIIDTLLEEKPSEDLEEAAEGYAYGGISNELKPLMKPLADEIIRNFIAGAEWQKEQMMKDLEEDALLLERAWLTLDGFGHEELAERLRKLKEKIC